MTVIKFEIRTWTSILLSGKPWYEAELDKYFLAFWWLVSTETVILSTRIQTSQGKKVQWLVPPIYLRRWDDGNGDGNNDDDGCRRKHFFVWVT